VWERQALNDENRWPVIPVILPRLRHRNMTLFYARLFRPEIRSHLKDWEHGVTAILSAHFS